MPKVTINAPKTPVTKGSTGIAAATIPNICKMPGPPAPFVPTPLPNIGKSGDSPQGYSTTVKIEGQPVAIRGASFGSMGDVASQGTGGGIVSSNTQGPTKFIGPGALNVKIEGKNVQLLGDPMLNNCGPGGSPANAATMTGVIQAPGSMLLLYGDDQPCSKCHKTHKGVPATEEVKASVADLFRALKAALAAQRERIVRLAQLRRAGASSEATALKSELSAIAVLKYSRETCSFTRGYMVGALICKCGTKRLVACSGRFPTRGFRRVASESGFTLVDSSTRSAAQAEEDDDTGWECAARHLFENLNGHEPAQMTERWFAPHIRTVIGPAETPRVMVEFKLKGLDKVPRRVVHTFRHGQSVPSCDKCQSRLAKKACGNECQ
jgi:hypothetical protein